MYNSETSDRPFSTDQNLGKVLKFHQKLSRTGIKSQNFILIIFYSPHKSDICFTMHQARIGVVA